MKKDAGYRIRIDPSLRQAFLDVCKSIDRPAAQIVREFMREFVENHKDTRQTDLFDTATMEGEQQ